MKTTLMNNWKSMEIFTDRLRSNLVKMLNKGKQVTRFKVNCDIGDCDIGDWEISQINRFMRIFPQVNITYSGKFITIEMC